MLDPTCGSGTTAYVAEQWGRRWITIDTSRVALALARSRVMGARYSYYLLLQTARRGFSRRRHYKAITTVPSDSPTCGDIRQGFVYQRVPHITLKSIANNVEIDVIWERWQERLEPLRAELNTSLGSGRSGRFHGRAIRGRLGHGSSGSWHTKTGALQERRAAPELQ